MDSLAGCGTSETLIRRYASDIMAGNEPVAKQQKIDHPPNWGQSVASEFHLDMGMKATLRQLPRIL